MLNVRNATTNVDSFLSIFSSGDYKTTYFLYDDEDEKLAGLTLFEEIISSYKETFGCYRLS